jgi:hypothetical protein
MRRTWIGLVAVALALTSCSSQGTPAAGGTQVPAPTIAGGGAPGQSAPGGATTPGTGGGPSAPAASNPVGTQLVQFDRSGGLMGASDVFVVYENGSYTLIRVKPKKVETKGQLTLAELANLRQTLDAADFPHLPKMSTGHGADLFTYAVGYHGVQVSAQDGAVPAKLQPVITLLSDLLAQHST